MKQRLCILIVLLLSLGFISALEFDNVAEYTPEPSPYGKYEIVNAFGLGETLAKAELIDNECENGEHCQAIIPIELKESGRLIQGIRFYRLDDGSNDQTNIRWSKLEYLGDIKDYETQCLDEWSDTNKSFIKVCNSIVTGAHEGWIEFNIDDEFESQNYTVRLSGGIARGREYDWQVNIKGEWTTAWAVWGNISLGDTAEVILTNPQNGLNNYLSNPISFNATANIISGAFFTNISLWSNLSGTWSITNSTIIVNVSSDQITTDSGWIPTYTLLCEGNKFLAKKDMTVISVNFSTSTIDPKKPTKAYLVYNGSLVDSAAIVSDRAVLHSNKTILNNTNFTILSGSDGVNMSYLYKNVAYNGGTFNKTARVWYNCGSWASAVGSDTQLGNIISLEYGSGINTTNISFLSDMLSKNILWNIQACDTDGTCGFAPQNRTLSYKVLENSRSFSSPVTETTLDTFIINVSANTSLTNVYLNYNGTEYITSGMGGIYTKQLTIPSVSTTTQIPVYWRFNYAGENITSDITYQTINKIVFQLCNATVNKTLINLTTKSAENPFPLVNSTIKTNWFISTSADGTPTTFNYEDLTVDNSSYVFCTDNDVTTFYTSAEIEYGSTGYATNFYFLNDAQLIASDQENISLYLLNDSKATTTVLRVEDTSQSPFENYIVQIQSYDIGTGTFYTVGMARTDYKGEDVVYLNWYDTLYKFIIIDESGEVAKTTGTTKITSTPTIIEIASNIEFVYDKFDNFIYTLYFDNSTNNFVLTYTMPTGEVDSACLRVYKEDSLNQTLICDTCETSSSATIFCNIATYGNGRFTAVFYALGSHKLIDWIYEYIGGRFQEDIYNLLGNEDASFYAFLLASLITVALFVNAIFGIIALIIGLIIASALGFTAIQWTEMMGIIAVGGVVIWIIKR